MTTDYGISVNGGNPNYAKTPDETIRVPFHWAEALDGETLLTTAYELPDGLTNEAEEDEDSVQSVLVSGGNAGTYRVQCTVTTSGGRELQQVKRVVVREA